MFTIGQLAKRAGLNTSTLRYYESQGLLIPSERSDSGYRLYRPEAEQTLQFIQRAQRLGFSLEEIGTLLRGVRANDLSNAAIIATAEARYLALERQVTALLTLQHELQFFLQDLRGKAGQPDDNAPATLFGEMLARVCANPVGQLPAGDVLDWLLEQTGCALNDEVGREVIERLRGQHIHIWQKDDRYHILITSDSPEVVAALEELARIEAECHAHPAPQLRQTDEGYLFTARGENAFIFARLFLALEGEGH